MKIYIVVTDVVNDITSQQAHDVKMTSCACWGIPAKVLLHVWSYDFYDMTLSTGKQRRHMIIHNMCNKLCQFNAAFTLITIRPRLVSWWSSWTNRDYRIQSYQIVSHLDVNRDNRANRGKFFGCQKFCHDYHDWRDHRGHRIRSYDIVTNRNESYLILFLNRGYRDRPKHYDLFR